ncbi:MAG TPA: sensor histidine kinase [Methylomirabilota bacterium]|nr:sensor histidine kinase [Methylomirabilota bacterium]
MTSSKEFYVLGAVLIVTAAQELLELLDLERGQAGEIGLLRMALQLGQVLAILAVIFAGFRLWQGKVDEVEQVRGRMVELEQELAERESRERAVARSAEQATSEREEERRLLAYDIHDGLAQIIVSAKQHLDTFEDLWREDPAQAGPELEKGLDRLGRAVVETRLLLATLRPGGLTSQGLVPAVRALLEDMGRREGWKTTLTADLGDGRLPGTVEVAVYRIVQEALTNVLKHAHAGAVGVALHRDRSTLRVEVTDTGTGIALPTSARALHGLGLAGMQERARLVGGSCQIEGVAPAGTRVQVTIPLKDSA